MSNISPPRNSKLTGFLTKLFIVIGSLASIVQDAHSLTYTVRPGSGGNFTTIQACANVAQPGDTCTVFDGTYDEHVVTKASGTTNNYISFKASGKVVMRGFDIVHHFISIEGFEITGFHATTGLIRVSGAHDVRIRGNTVRDGISISLDDIAIINEGTQDRINSSKGGFAQSRIVVGDKVSVQCRDQNNNSAVLAWVSVLKITNNDLTVEYLGGAKPGPLYCYFSIPVVGILTHRTTDHVEISNNVITNLDVGDLSFLEISGESHLIEKNDINTLNGGDAFRLFGKNHIIRENYIHDSVVKRAANNHPDIFQVFALLGNTTESYNMLIEKNFITRHQGYQFAQLVPILTDSTGPHSELIRDWKFLHNVITDINLGPTLGIPDQQWINNTFYRVNTQGDGPIILGTYGTNATIKNNLFLGNGAKDSPSAGWYGSTLKNVRDSMTAHHNFVSGLPPTFLPKQKRPAYCQAEQYPAWDFCEATGVNGGDPRLQNVSSPVGTDGQIFTDDDGLIPLNVPGSLVCSASDMGGYLGAYPCKAADAGPHPPKSLRIGPG